jgi:transposase-like protein
MPAVRPSTFASAQARRGRRQSLFSQGLQDTRTGVPRTITLDGYQVSHRAVRELRAEDRRLRVVTVRSCQYLNNIVEQDHRGVKLRLPPMLGFKNFAYAASTIAGVELLHRIRKNQFALNRLHVRSKSTPEIWNAVLTA